jgi:protein tyrosine phosphatase
LTGAAFPVSADVVFRTKTIILARCVSQLFKLATDHCQAGIGSTGVLIVANHCFPGIADGIEAVVVLGARVIIVAWLLVWVVQAARVREAGVVCTRIQILALKLGIAQAHAVVAMVV